ncbi:hypothetical protein G5V59_10390 [Nocardioides sp. W3-2-3]|uniref:hypothetical protein n=1 Tax=Nocardioides convexus TaxID=2712224 RepID=UPI0024188E48|nr:hypothetical protein [Nocardioides convexus]NHA00365.1 hypothetical protein [Nocardioides convexus]
MLDRIAFEAVATGEAGLAFWDERLRRVDGVLPALRSAAVPAPMTTPPAVPVPAGARGSLFPAVLFSLHRAVRDVTTHGVVLGYPWGGREGGFADVAGCFMNTVVSVDTTGPGRDATALQEFVADWRRELGHADVPFTALTGLGGGFTGAVTAQAEPSRTPGSRWSTWPVSRPVSSRPGAPTRSRASRASWPRRPSPTASLRLRLYVDPGLLGADAEELGARWGHWLGAVLAGVPASPAPRTQTTGTHTTGG